MLEYDDIGAKVIIGSDSGYEDEVNELVIDEKPMEHEPEVNESEEKKNIQEYIFQEYLKLLELIEKKFGKLLIFVFKFPEK